MDLKRCANGHFYDGEKFAFCPHCQGGSPGGGNETIPFVEKAGGEAPTMSVGSAMNQPPMQPARPPVAQTQPLRDTQKKAPDDDAKTVGFFGLNNAAAEEGEEYVEPVVGWLVCTKGKHMGKDFRLKAGRNFIGRSSDMDVALTGETSVSREGHAVIAYEPHQSIFIAQPGAASELFYLNNAVVLSAVQIKRNDRLQLGEVELMLIPCCDENFKWELENPNKE